MRIVLFCEQQYAIRILLPLQEAASRIGGSMNNLVMWYIHKKNILDFPLKDHVRWTHSMQEIYDFAPEAIFVPCNIVPYYLPGVKIQIFHGYAGEKKGHWVIRRYFDTYFTQGPHFTRGFQSLARKYNDFEVVETGWPQQDWIYAHRHDFDAEKAALLQRHGKRQVVLYAPTFSPSMTSLPFLQEALTELVHREEIILLLKFHPLTKPEWIETYKAFAAKEEHVVWINDHNVTKYELMADVMISDTSSVVYEFLLLNKPVITYKSIAREIYSLNIEDPAQLHEAFLQVQTDSTAIQKRQWVVDNYDPHLDGKVCERMLAAAQDYIDRHGVPTHRKVNLWRKYTSIKRFGRIKRHSS